MTEAIRQWLRRCPLIKNENEFNLNFLAGKPTSYSLERVPANQELTRYLDGSVLEQRSYVLATREAYSSDVLQNIKVSAFFEELQRWIQEQNKRRNFPQIENAKVQRIEIANSFYLYSEEFDTARYQLQLAITIYRKRVHK